MTSPVALRALQPALMPFPHECLSVLFLRAADRDHEAFPTSFWFDIKLHSISFSFDSFFLQGSLNSSFLVFCIAERYFSLAVISYVLLVSIIYLGRTFSVQRIYFFVILEIWALYHFRTPMLPLDLGCD